MTDSEARDYGKKKFYSLEPMTLPGEIPDPKMPALTPDDLIKELKDDLDLCLFNEVCDKYLNPSFELQEKMFISGLADTANKIIRVLECMSFHSKEIAASKLAEVARAGAQALNRETERGNEWITEILPYCSTWPTMYSPHGKINEEFTHQLEERKMGSQTLPSVKRIPWESASNRLVCAIYDYIQNVRRSTKHWQNDFLRIKMKIEIPKLARKVHSLPETLTEDNYKDWYEVGKMVLSEATNGRGKDHPAFRNDTLISLFNTGPKWTDRIKDSWKNLAKANKSLPRTEVAK